MMAHQVLLGLLVRLGVWGVRRLPRSVVVDIEKVLGAAPVWSMVAARQEGGQRGKDKER